jgi:hypothetical protein
MLTSAIWSGWKVGIVQCHGVYSVIFAFDNRQRKSQYKVRTTCTSPVDVGHVGCSGYHGLFTHGDSFSLYKRQVSLTTVLVKIYGILRKH